MLNKRELELVYRMFVRDSHCEKALFTKEEERSEYQKEMMELWDKVEKLAK